MAQNIVDVNTYTAPIVAPADGDTLNAASIVDNAIQGLSNRTRRLLNVLQNTNDVESPQARQTRIYPSLWEATQQNSNPGWEMSTPHIARCPTAGQGEAITCNLTRYIPSGVTITAIRVLWDADQAGGVGMIFQLVSRTGANFSTGSPAVGTEVVAQTVGQGGAALEAILLPGGSFTLDQSHTLRVFSNTTITSFDLLYGVEVDFTDLGPRNF